MDMTELRFVLTDQQKIFEKEDPFVKRKLLSRLMELIKLKMPIVITGVRRSGKSYLMKQLKDTLKLKPKQFIYIDFNDERLAGFGVKDFQLVLNYLVENEYEKETYLFLDEIQEIDYWEKWINRIKTDYHIIITGSNSKLLSPEIATTLTGRTLSLGMTPFDFKEFLDAMKFDYHKYETDLEIKAKTTKYFQKYLVMGGFPMYVLNENNTILRELYDSLLYRDIIKRFGKNEKQIRELSNYLLSNPTHAISFRNISELLGIKNRTIVKNIVLAFEKSLAFFLLPKYDYSIKKQIQNPQKVYCIDNGLLTTLGFKFSDNEGKLLENLVAIELKRRNQDIYYYNGTKECDFILREGNQITYAIQVTTKLTTENQERELAGLQEAMTKLKAKNGLILTLSQEEEIKLSGKKIVVKPVWKWLLENQ